MIARYGAIQAVRDVCEPWIEIWGGDEWGESMRDLYGAAHTSYGLMDEDCALLAEMLLRNIIAQREWIEDEGHSYGLSTPEQESYAREKATDAREYWLKGGNLGRFGSTIEDAKSVIDTMPAWMFND